METDTLITIERQQFSKAFSRACEAVPSRTAKDVLKNVLLVSTGWAIELSASNGEQHIKSTLAHAGDKVRCLIPAARMKQVLNEIESEMLTITCRETELTIKGGSAVFKLQTADAAEFPDVPTFNASSYYEVDASVLGQLIKRTIFCIDNESTRYALGGIQMEITGAPLLTLASTDSRRLSVATGTCAAIGKPVFNSSNKPTIPGAAMKLVAASLESGAAVKIALGVNEVSFQIGDVSISSQLLQGRFPDYRKVCPEESSFTRTVSLPVGQFARLLSAARVMESVESKGVSLDFQKGTLGASSSTTEIGNAKAEMPIAFDGFPIAIDVIGQYLSELCKTLDPSAVLEVGLINPDDRLSFCVEGLKHIVMPLSREEQPEPVAKPKKEKAIA